MTSSCIHDKSPALLVATHTADKQLVGVSQLKKSVHLAGLKIAVEPETERDSSECSSSHNTVRQQGSPKMKLVVPQNQHPFAKAFAGQLDSQALERCNVSLEFLCWSHRKARTLNVGWPL